MRIALLAALTISAFPLGAKDAAPFDPAVAFGARPSVVDISLSPDGKSIAYLAPAAGQGSVLYTLKLEADAKSRRALAVDGKPVRLEDCHWVSNDRLTCDLYGVVRDSEYLLPFNRLLAVNADGSNQQMLSTSGNTNSRGYLLSGAAVVRRNGRKLRELGPGEMIGEIGLLNDGPRTATVTLTQPSRVLALTARDFRSLLKDQPDLALKVLATVAERLNASASG